MKVYWIRLKFCMPTIFHFKFNVNNYYGFAPQKNTIINTMCRTNILHNHHLHKRFRVKHASSVFIHFCSFFSRIERYSCVIPFMSSKCLRYPSLFCTRLVWNKKISVSQKYRNAFPLVSFSMWRLISLMMEEMLTLWK